MQGFQATFYNFILILGALIPGGLMIYAWRKRETPGAKPFVALMLAICIWGGSYFLSILAGTNLELKFFWAKIQYLGVVFTPVFWFIFAVEYSGQEKWITRQRVILLSLIPSFSLLLLFTNNLHNLFFIQVTAVQTGPFWIVGSEFGPFFWVHTTYTYLVILVGFILVIRALTRQISVYRGQIVGILLGLAAPLISNVVTISGLLQVPIDLTPFSFSITGLVTAWTLFRFRLFDLAPIARDTVIEGMKDGMIVLDAQGRIVDINATANKVLGASSSEIVGQTLDVFFKNQPELVKRYQKSTEGVDEISLGEGTAQRFFELQLSALRSRRGNLVGRVITVHDITERKESEATLRLQAAALDAAANAIAITDTQSFIQWVNPAFTTLTGYPAEDVLYQKINILRSGEHSPEFYEILWKTINDGKIWQGEIINRRKDGSLYIESQTITPLLNEKGEIYRFISIKQDVTELINTRDRALEASQFKSELLARVSHELRTPLGAIIGYTELLHSGIYGELTPPQLKITSEVIDSAKQLTHMVNELLEEARLDAHAVKLDYKPFAPQDLLQTIEIRMDVLAKNKGLTLSTSLSSEVPPSMMGDESRLQQIMINLIGNAIKFTANGTINVRLHCPTPERWAIEVKDTGPGIPPEAQKYIFEPFRQLDGTMTRQHGGTGLGLSITKRLVELMGGGISLESEPGQGCTFTVLLPIQIVDASTL